MSLFSITVAEVLLIAHTCISFFCFKGKVNDVPMCMSFSNNLIYVGDSKGHLHLINPAEGQFNIVDVSSSTYVLQWRPADKMNSQFQKDRHALHTFFEICDRTAIASLHVV
jgi:hypothetical protein